MNIKIENHKLLIDGVVIEDLPKLADSASVSVYSVPTAYKESGFFVAVNSGNKSELPASSSYELLVTLELEPSEEAVLDRAKFEVLQRAINDADRLLSMLEKDSSEREVKTWDQQAIESAQTGSGDKVLIDSIAYYRGVSVEDLLQKIVFKSNLYKETAGAIIGAKQFVEDQIDAAENIDDLFSLGSVQDRLNEMSQ